MFLYMTKVETVLGSMNGMNGLSRGNTFIRHLDPRAMLITAMAFIVVVTSFGKYDILGLLPLVIYPVSLMALGNFSFRSIGKKLVYVSPFAIVIGIFNPLFDNQILVQIGDVGISGGWVSFGAIMIKFVLTVSVALILVALSGFEEICHALVKLKVPKVFVSQLLFMHRYIYVMADEASRMVRAHTLRSFKRRGMKISVFCSIISQLLLRTLDRAHRIHTAMVSRGFAGEIPVMHGLKAAPGDVAFVLLWSAFFVLARLYNLPQWLGFFVMEGLT